MATESNKDYRVKVYQKGQVVIPVDLRRRYGINVGDRVDAVPTADGILIKPGPEAQTAVTETDRLFGALKRFKVRHSRLPGKRNISKATENGFTEGWME
jgi:AbrB family looped-hinge helix DNA binding protein